MKAAPAPPLDLAGQIAEPKTGMVTRLAGQVLRTINELIRRSGGPTWPAVPIPSYTVAELPTTGLETPSIAFCSNESGGAVLVVWDGTNWRRATDRAVAS